MICVKKVVLIWSVVTLAMGAISGCRVPVQTPSPSTIAIPENIRATVDGCHTIRINWDAVEEAAEYRVMLESPDTKPSEQADSMNAQAESLNPMVQSVSQTEAVFANLPADTDFLVTVAAVRKKDGETVLSQSSERLQAKTGVPSVPEGRGLTAVPLDEQTIRLEWTACSSEEVNADGSSATIRYAIYAAAEETGPYEPLAENLMDFTYTHTDLSAYTIRFYKLAVVLYMDGQGFSGPLSEAVSATTPDTTTVPLTTTTSAVTTTKKPTTPKPGTTTKPTPSKKEQARIVAQKIADSIGPGTDLERVGQAAAVVSQYCNKATYTTSGKDYSQAYGVFIKGEYSCAGATRALGMVLECMGYAWEHVNENQWSHQWCKLTMDGQIGWADGQIGWVGYGEHPAAN